MEQAIDWKNLGFEYMDTGSHVRAEFKDGQWTRPQLVKGNQLNLHIASTCLHYGQACFEGVKVFQRVDGTVACFRAPTHADRFASSAARLCMTAPPSELFIEAVATLVRANRSYIPPYGTGASFYVRPLLIGSSPIIGVHESHEYIFIVLGLPVGPYYKNGMVPVRGLVQEQYDRAAPNGVGHVKAAGNYAAGMLGDKEARARNFDISLYLDSATHTFVDEFTTSNFIGITRDRRFVTPDSKSVLPSVTNNCLQQIAADMGFTIERRPVRWDEIGNFSEIGACGTAAVITPLYSLTRGSETLTFGDPKTPGPVLSSLYAEIQAIQYGTKPDRWGWIHPLST